MSNYGKVHTHLQSQCSHFPRFAHHTWFWALPRPVPAAPSPGNAKLTAVAAPPPAAPQSRGSAPGRSRSGASGCGGTAHSPFLQLLRPPSAYTGGEQKGEGRQGKAQVQPTLTCSPFPSAAQRASTELSRREDKVAKLNRTCGVPALSLCPFSLPLVKPTLPAPARPPARLGQPRGRAGVPVPLLVPGQSTEPPPICSGDLKPRSPAALCLPRAAVTPPWLLFIPGVVVSREKRIKKSKKNTLNN
ncbi:nascent polypeptide-associated complex subunit alpha, muscle-specific form-like [Molothrus aeneus]|uniref:nascent polypeptide-associated complex subunit alpha, muscle-specific form-like n=1 Tax=Molothrus aeneus TaxID=84833 RepID=UPI003458EDDB